MGLFGLRPCTWTIHSKLDPRWNATGRGETMAFSCPELDAKIKELREMYGDPPEDANLSVWKD